MTLNLAAADAYCRFLTRQHYENFNVASHFVNETMRRDLSRIYAYCRTTDDLGDKSRDGSAIARLERWKSEVSALFEHVPPVHPVLVALDETIARHAMPAAPFLDLIAANVQDQYVSQYETWEQLDRYCRLSAAPVGRMVLRLFDADTAEAVELSDAVCIGLQLANHAQDVSRDAAIGRRYLVGSDIAAGGTVGAVVAMVARARSLLGAGERLERLAPRVLRAQLALYRMGGLAICDAIERAGYKTEDMRPSVSASTKVLLLARAALQAFAQPRPE